MKDIGIGIKREQKRRWRRVGDPLGERRTAISQKRVLKRRAYSTTRPGKIQAIISRQTQMVCCRMAPEVSGGPSTNRGMREQSPGKQLTTTMYIPHGLKHMDPVTNLRISSTERKNIDETKQKQKQN